ncbi:Uncharacterised protein [Yersinia intermedia]|uniref:hypothetical protein n=1 Tax=Yersinia intermedia TaxID=631 RepID=UPI0005EA674E|nr:hypothetical protein [Yersinia intermedia]CND08198.1 Uncharacterised protein [Yersinia intermedia]CNH34627.1 Uncharacterised protein [Yersinia intermedia]
MKKNILIFAFISVISTPAFALNYETSSCHTGKYIVGISGNYQGEGVTALYLSDSINGKPNPEKPIPFVERDYFWNMKFLYSIAQNAMNLHQKIYSMDCDPDGKIVGFSIVRTNE